MTLATPSHPDLLVTAPWPVVAESTDDTRALETVERLQALTLAIRNLRGEHKVPPKKKIRLHLAATAMELVEAGGGLVQTMAGVESVEPVNDGNVPDGTIPLAFEGDRLFLGGLVEAVDVEAEHARLTGVCADMEKAAAHFSSKLDNKAYVKNAPAHLVEQTRTRLNSAEADLTAARLALDLLEKD